MFPQLDHSVLEVIASIYSKRMMLSNFSSKVLGAKIPGTTCRKITLHSHKNFDPKNV